VRHEFSQEHRPISQTIERLDSVSRAMNPVLFLVAVALVVLNLACVVNLIDWRGVVP
jgi:high-affinity K+ transport system ATPase subunit B